MKIRNLWPHYFVFFGRLFLLNFQENGVTDEMLVEFTEEDIKDVFTTFSDRFKVRKRLESMRKESNTKPKTLQGESTVSAASGSGKSDSESTVSAASGSGKGDSESTVSDNIYAAFSAYEMLQRKIVRGRPSDAQKIFRTLLRDAAVEANVWKRAPTLADISDSNKVSFFKFFEIAPQLLNYKKELWKRLGESLQNRRKYISDKQTGKRGTKAKKDDEDISMSPLLCHLKVGDNVNLLSSEKVKVGEGILIKKGHMFSEIVLKKVITETEVIKETLIKRVIQYKTSRVQKSKTSASAVQKSKTSVGAVQKSTSSVGAVQKSKTSAGAVQKSKTSVGAVQKSTSSVGAVQTSKTSKTSTSSVGRVQKSKSSSTTEVFCGELQISQSPASSVDGHQTSNSRTSTEDSCGELHESQSPTSSIVSTGAEQKLKDTTSSAIQNWKSITSEVSATISGHSPTSSVSEVPELASEILSSKTLVGVYEWGKGELFLGLLTVDEQGRDGSIINCLKPIGKIINADHEPELKIFIDEENLKSKKEITLNDNDRQNDPNISYCVMKMRLNIINGVIQFPNIKKFIDALKRKFEEYAYDN